MSDTTLTAMLIVAVCFAAMLALRAVYVVVFYKSWTMGELFGFSDGGWEPEGMRKRRRNFWR